MSSPEQPEIEPKERFRNAARVIVESLSQTHAAQDAYLLLARDAVTNPIVSERYLVKVESRLDHQIKKELEQTKQGADLSGYLDQTMLSGMFEIVELRKKLDRLTAEDLDRVLGWNDSLNIPDDDKMVYAVRILLAAGKEEAALEKLEKVKSVTMFGYRQLLPIYERLLGVTGDPGLQHVVDLMEHPPYFSRPDVSEMSGDRTEDKGEIVQNFDKEAVVVSDRINRLVLEIKMKFSRNEDVSDLYRRLRHSAMEANDIPSFFTLANVEHTIGKDPKRSFSKAMELTEEVKYLDGGHIQRGIIAQIGIEECFAGLGDEAQTIFDKLNVDTVRFGESGFIADNPRLGVEFATALAVRRTGTEEERREKLAEIRKWVLGLSVKERAVGSASYIDTLIRSNIRLTESDVAFFEETIAPILKPKHPRRQADPGELLSFAKVAIHAANQKV